MSLPAGFIEARPTSASGKSLSGRFTCEDVQWTGSGPDLLATFTITARELLDAADSNILWTDQDVQRGTKPEHDAAPRQLSLSQGYPDPEKYIFIDQNSDEIADKLLHGGKLFLSPLVWNLRPGQFEAYRDDESENFTIYSGRVYLPDSHHRHQGILKATRAYIDSPEDYPAFSLSRQFKVDIYFLSKVDEGNFFYDKNQRTRATAKSKAFDLTTDDALSLLAKSIAASSSALRSNVNRVTDRLTSRNPQVITLSTLREMGRSIVPQGEVSEQDVESLGVLIGGFYDKLAVVRPELGVIPLSDRVLARQDSLADSAVTMHGYAYLVREYIGELPTLGSVGADRVWSERLARLGSTIAYSYNGWQGDLFSKSNPLWQAIGVLKPSNRGGFSQVNNGATRAAMGRELSRVIHSTSTDLRNL